MANSARSILFPNDNRILLRVAFLYVGQGSSAIIFAKEGNGYRAILVDIHLGRNTGGIDVPRVVKEVVGDSGLDIFINTHPHNDHLLGLEDLDEEVKIHRVLHSGHIPGEEDEVAYKQLERVMENVKKAGGTVEELEGSRSPFPLSEAEYYVLGPALHVTDSVNDEDPKVRRARIHEQCAVLKFGKGNNWIMIPGDADRAAFEKHITNYHKDRMSAYVLAASHHGSRTFFRDTEEQEAYHDALNAIAPSYIVVSAPTQEESRHDHPHDDAMEIYEDAVGEENVLHTGEERHSFIFDIYTDATRSGPQTDGGKLAEDYGLTDDDDGGDGGKGQGPFVSPASKSGDLVPRKFG
jgi:competence protein ComEC